MSAWFVYTESNNGGIVPPQYVDLDSKGGVMYNTTEFASASEV